MNKRSLFFLIISLFSASLIGMEPEYDSTKFWDAYHEGFDGATHDLWVVTFFVGDDDDECENVRGRDGDHNRLELIKWLCSEDSNLRKLFTSLKQEAIESMVSDVDALLRLSSWKVFEASLRKRLMEHSEVHRRGPINDLPVELLSEILGWLGDPKHFFETSLVNSSFHMGARKSAAVLCFTLPRDESKRLMACRNWCVFFGVRPSDQGDEAYSTTSSWQAYDLWNRHRGANSASKPMFNQLRTLAGDPRSIDMENMPNLCSLELRCTESASMLISEFGKSRSRTSFLDNDIACCLSFSEYVTSLVLYKMFRMNGSCVALFPELRRLEIVETIRRRSFEPENLVSTPNLEYLIIDRSKRVRDNHFSQLTKLKSLELRSCPKTSGACLENMPDLVSLIVCDPSLSLGFDFSKLRDLSSLQKLHVKDGCSFLTDAQLEGLDLRVLILEGFCGVTGSCLSSMRRLKRVAILRVEGFDERVLEELQERGVEVEFVPHVPLTLPRPRPPSCVEMADEGIVVVPCRGFYANYIGPQNDQKGSHGQ